MFLSVKNFVLFDVLLFWTEKMLLLDHYSMFKYLSSIFKIRENDAKLAIQGTGQFL